MGTDEGLGAPDRGLQFDKVEMAVPQAARACRRCQRPMGDEYFEIAGHVVCGACAAQLRGAAGGGSLGRALGLGLGAAGLGPPAWLASIKAPGAAPCRA